jgi:putative membrane protein
MTLPSGQNFSASPDSSYLALERTRLAYERTLLAWVRTAVALITFGFSVYKFYQYLQQLEPERPTTRLFGPREFALTMISIGLVALLLATLEHRRHLKTMRAQFGTAPVSLSGLFAGLIACLGILGFVIVIFKQ